MDPLQACALVATVWLAAAALLVLIVLPNCPRSDADPVDPVSRNLRNSLHAGSDTVA